MRQALVRLGRFLARMVRGAHAGAAAETELTRALKGLAAGEETAAPAIRAVARCLAGVPPGNIMFSAGECLEAEADFRATHPEVLVLCAAPLAAPEDIRARHARLNALHLWTPERFGRALTFR